MFESLELSHFKCFESFEKPIFFRQINLLTGSNGRGKSSIFQSILLLAQSYELGKDWKSIQLKGRFVELGNYKDVIYNGQTDTQLSITLTTDNETYNTMKFVCQGSKDEGIGCDIDNIYVNGEALFDEIGMGNAISDENNVGKDTATPLQKVVLPTSTYDCFTQLASVYYISAERLGPRNAVKMIQGRVSDQIGIHGERVLNSLYDGKENFQKEVANAMSVILGGASVKVLNSEDYEYVKALLDSKDNQEGYKPVNVGFGYSYILPLIVLPMLVPDKSKIFIENPEAHLHPGAQSRLMDYLISIAKEKDLQLFIETHSDHFVNALRIATKKRMHGINHHDSAIIHINRNEAGKASFAHIKMDKDGNLSDYPRDFMDEWTKQMLYLV